MYILKTTSHSLTVMVLLCASMALGETVFRTVDESGVVSFSDTPPAGDGPVESIIIQPPPPQSPETARQRLEDMRETTDRMAADRREREKHRAQMRELYARSQPTPQPRYVEDDYYDPYYPVYTTRRTTRKGYYGGIPWRPGYGGKPRPEHPIARPPGRPGGIYRPRANVNLGSNAQLMRPIVSPRR